MSKQKVTPEQIEKAESSLNLLTLGQESPLTWKEAWDILEGADSAQMMQLNADYVNFELGKEYNMVFDGFQTITMTDKTSRQKKQVECVILRDKAGEKKLSGLAVLVSSCKNLTNQPAWIRITVGEKMISGPNGNYMDITVRTF